MTVAPSPIPYPLERKKFRLAIHTQIAEATREIPITHLGSLNVAFQYLYRDASNFKLHGETIFTNDAGMSIDEIEQQIRLHLNDGKFFIARQIHIEERFFDVPDGDDHPWHEFDRVEPATDPAWDPDAEAKRDITEFIAELENAAKAGWDETNVRHDLAEMLKQQKQEIRNALKANSQA